MAASSDNREIQIQVVRGAYDSEKEVRRMVLEPLRKSRRIFWPRYEDIFGPEAARAVADARKVSVYDREFPICTAHAAFDWIAQLMIQNNLAAIPELQQALQAFHDIDPSQYYDMSPAMAAEARHRRLIGSIGPLMHQILPTDPLLVEMWHMPPEAEQHISH